MTEKGGGQENEVINQQVIPPTQESNKEEVFELEKEAQIKRLEELSEQIKELLAIQKSVEEEVNTDDFPLPENLKAEMESIPGQAKVTKALISTLTESQFSIVYNLKKLDFEKDADMTQARDLIARFASLTRQIIQQKNFLDRLYGRAKRAEEEYRQKVIDSSGISTSEELESELSLDYHELWALRRQAAGPIVHKKRIRELEKRIKYLQGTRDELRFHAPYVDTSSYSEMRKSSDLSNEALTAIAEKIRDKVEKLAENKASLSKEVLSEEQIEKLNNALISEFVIPYANEEEVSPSQRKEVIDLLRESFKISMKYDSFSFREQTDEELKAREINKRIMEMGYPGSHVFYRFVAKGGSKPANAKYQEMLNLITNLESFSKELEHKNRLVNVTSGLQQILQSSSRYMEAWQVQRLETSLRETPSNLDSIIDGFDLNRWKVMKASVNDPEKLAASEKLIAQRISERLLSSEPRKDDTIDLGSKIYNFPCAEAAAVAVMNAYRETGHSGEMPFVLFYQKAENTLLFNFVSNLTAEDLAKIEAQNIPGLFEVITLIKENPTNFNKANNFTEEQGFVDNPIYDQIYNQLGQMTIHYLEHGSLDEKYFVQHLLGRVGGNFDEHGYAVIENALRTEKNSKTKEAIVEMLMDRVDRNDLNVAKIAFENFDLLPLDLKNKIESYTPRLIAGLVNQPLSEKVLTRASEILGVSPSELQTTLNFIGNLETVSHYYGYNEARHFEDYVKLAQDPRVFPLIQELYQNGYFFSIYDAELIPELLANKEKILNDIKDIQKDFPDFRFGISSVYHAGKRKDDKLFDPYELISFRFNNPESQKNFFQLKREGKLSRSYTDGLLNRLRKGDPLLFELENPADVSEEKRQLFEEGIGKYLEKFLGDESRKQEVSHYLASSSLLEYIARQPEKIDEVFDLPNQAPEFFNLIRPGGPLFSNADLIFKSIFSNGDFLKRVKDIETIFTKKVPRWQQLFMFTDVRLGDKLAQSFSRYPIDKISGIELTSIIEHHKTLKAKNPNELSRFEKIVPNVETREQILSGELDSIPFSELSGVYKRIVFRDYLRRTVESSRDVEEKKKANLRNRETNGELLELSPGTYIHGSAIDYLPMVLLNGNLPHEALGEGAETDGYPFQVDFSCLVESDIERDQTPNNIINNSISSGYGTGGKYEASGQVFYIYDRENTSWEPGKVYGPEGRMGRHTLILGGMPATEISSIVLRSDVAIEEAKKAILENGFYIPIYSMDGHLLFSAEEFDDAFENENLSVPVEVWDYSLKTGPQLGSNPGGEFTVPTSRGPVKYYVKFASPNNLEHLWNEQLSDSFYKAVNLPVPETKIVQVEGVYGHASEILTPDSESDASLKDGFLMDALLANWDIPYNSANHISVNKQAVRIDNGGALLFRARGDRKGEEAFGNFVNEINDGEDRQRLGLGMRQEYRDLTDEDLKTQASVMKEKLTDEEIDRLVESVRLPKSDRDYLKTTIKARRDNILERISI